MKARVSIGLAVLCLLAVPAASSAQVDDSGDAAARADRLVEEGNALGAKGNYEAALEKWREADRLVRRPLHACNIGLAYVRLAAMRTTYWAQAHYYLSRCQTNWTDGEMPSWVATRTAESLEALTKGDFAKASITVTPADAEWTISFLENDKEVFTGRRDFWVPFGQHVVIANHADYDTGTLTVNVRDTSPQAAVLALKKPAPPEPVAQPTAVPAAALTADQPSAPGRGWLYAGIGTGALAGILGLTATVSFFKAKADADDAEGVYAGVTMDTPQLNEEFEQHKDDYELANGVKNITLVGAVLAAGASGFFFYKWMSADEETPAVGIAPTTGGAAASMQWSF